MKKYFALFTAVIVLGMTGCSGSDISDTGEVNAVDGGSASLSDGGSESISGTSSAAVSASADSSSGAPSGSKVESSSDTPAVSVPDEPATSAVPATSAEPATSAAATASTEYTPTYIGGSGEDGEIDTETGASGSFFEAISSIGDIFDSKSADTSALTVADYDEAYEMEADDAAGDWDYSIEVPIDPGYMEITPQAGLLTGGEWRDNDHWSDWNALYSSRDDWNGYKSDWRIGFDTRIAVKVTADGQPVEGASVTCSGATSAITDNNGMAYLFYPAINGPTEPIVVSYKGVTEQLDGVIGNAEVECELSGVSAEKTNKLDLMIMCDTTGSMSDELIYLQTELEDIVTRISSENSNTSTRLSINFYRDEGDEYVVCEYPFTEDIDSAVTELGKQSASGGGDYPEAVHTALDSAINNHDWDEDAVKIMFLVLDAPPHSDTQIVDSVNSLIVQAAEQGIRIIPIASSGIDKSTEYLLRTMAFTTGGTYTFLTDDSGVGGGHIEPTVGAYNVERLNDMMVRIVSGYLA